MIARPVLAALAAALLFGAGTPLSKSLLGNASPWMLAALLYLGSGAGLALVRLLGSAQRARLAPNELKWLAGAIVSGGVIGPVLLMLGLAAMPASSASLLLNAEAVFTALIAWIVFRENVDSRVFLGFVCIVAGAALVSWRGSLEWSGWRPSLLVLGACLAWGIDNNLTRKVSLTDASWIAMVKGLAAGSTNLVLAIALGASLPSLPVVAGAVIVGFASYGASLTLFVVALRGLGTARTGAYFSVAPFFGAIVAIAWLGDPLTWPLVAAGVLMAIGVALHLAERHEHNHSHEAMTHTHEHVHGEADEHHMHGHDLPVAPGTRHTHEHRHEPLAHTHAHYPDTHHRHQH
ncbi:MAG TPA: EamA family transporter [Ramlibacter sp.]|nr:EamA family transporter [Ramlibacter sp.]